MRSFNPIPWAAGVMVIMMAGFFIARKMQYADSRKEAVDPVSEVSGGMGAAPDFSLPSIEGGTVRLSELRGKVVLLNFWATWCPPCKKEIPDFIELQARYRAQDLRIVGIAIDDPDAVRAFAKESDINYTVLIGDDEVSRQYGGIESIPTTFVIDKEGTIRARYVGWQPPETWSAEISRFL